MINYTRQVDTTKEQCMIDALARIKGRSINVLTGINLEKDKELNLPKMNK
jgi:hypothetical protein